MSWITLKNKTVSIRKPRICEHCGTKHMPPDKMINIFAVDGGDTCNYYSCAPCDAFMADKWNDCDGEFTPFEIWEYDDYKAFREQFIKKQTTQTLF